MDTTILLIIVIAALVIIIGGAAYYLFFLRNSKQSSIQNLMGGTFGVGIAKAAATPTGFDNPFADSQKTVDFNKLRREAEKIAKVKNKPNLDDKFFRAGIFNDAEKKKFIYLKLIAPFVLAPLFGYLALMGGTNFGIVGLVIGGLIGNQLQSSILDRMIAKRDEDILYYLPLVIEQIAIGVSSSLDIGPCVQKVVQMADERDTHNVVSELLRIVTYLTKSGLSLEDALLDVGRRSQHVELKQTFTALGQVAKHGGEISKQLHELGDAVALQRETKIDSKIKKLELEATGPVALVFVGFLTIILIGFFLQVMKAFK